MAIIKKTCKIILAAILVLACIGCGGKTRPVFGFDDKIYLEEREDGWIYVSQYQYAGGDNHYEYDAYNLKYQYIEGYDLLIYDEVTNEVVGSATTAFPYMSLLPEAEKDIRNIQEFFEEKRISKPITMADLAELELGYVDKEDMLRLFNKTIVQEPLPEGKYASIPAASMAQSKMLDGYKWQGAYISCHGIIVALRFELIYEDGQYLSDLVEANTASAEQKRIYEKYKEIEKEILESNNFLVNSGIESLVIGNVDFGLLEKVLQMLETGDW